MRRFRLPGTIQLHLFYYGDRAVRVIFSIVDKLECPYDLRMFTLSSYDRRKFYHALPVFKSPLLRPGISISSHGRQAPIKETKWISTRDAAGGVIRRGTPLQHTKKGGRGNPKGKKEKEMLLPLLDPTRILVSYAQDAHLSRGR